MFVCLNYQLIFANTICAIFGRDMSTCFDWEYADVGLIHSNSCWLYVPICAGFFDVFLVYRLNTALFVE